MTYCTGSSSRDLFNYWGGEGGGQPSADSEGLGLRIGCPPVAQAARLAVLEGLGPGSWR